MWKYTLAIDGMMCEMCESHMNDVVRREVPGAKKVKSSHKKGRTEFVATEPVDEERLAASIKGIGYELQSMEKEDYEERGFFSRKK